MGGKSGPLAETQDNARITRRAGVCMSMARSRDHAASDGDGAGRSTLSGHTALSGQLSENQRIARSKFPVVRSFPATILSSAPPALKTMVETRARERPRAAA